MLSVLCACCGRAVHELAVLTVLLRCVHAECAVVQLLRWASYCHTLVFMQPRPAARDGVLPSLPSLNPLLPSSIPPPCYVPCSPILRREMEYCQAHPEEMSRMAAVQRKVDEVKNVMVNNVESVGDRMGCKAGLVLAVSGGRLLATAGCRLWAGARWARSRSSWSTTPSGWVTGWVVWQSGVVHVARWCGKVRFVAGSGLGIEIMSLTTVCILPCCFQVLARGENLDVLVNRTDDLRDQAQKFQRQGTQLRKRMW